MTRLPARLLALALILLPVPSRTDAAPEPLLTWHGGPVMGETIGYVVFWQPPGTHFQSGHDGHYRNTMLSYLRHVGGTPLYSVLTQYSRSPGGPAIPGGPITNRSRLAGWTVDHQPYPRPATADDPLLYRDFAVPVHRAMATHHWPHGIHVLYYLFLAGAPEACFVGDRECIPSTGCATHISYGTASAPLVVAVLPVIAAYPSCSRLGGAVTANGPDAAGREVSVVSHEQFEAVTDPVDGDAVTPLASNAWYDTSPAFGEIADLCINRPDVTPRSVSLHGAMFTIQPEWSNAAHACVWH